MILFFFLPLLSLTALMNVILKIIFLVFTGRSGEPLEWSARQKIAVGAARGLRYLHEECRVGCIVHRDMRPNNILITHDFEPLVWNNSFSSVESSRTHISYLLRLLCVNL